MICTFLYQQTAQARSTRVHVAANTLLRIALNFEPNSQQPTTNNCLYLPVQYVQIYACIRRCQPRLPLTPPCWPWAMCRPPCPAGSVPDTTSVRTADRFVDIAEHASKAWCPKTSNRVPAWRSIKTITSGTIYSLAFPVRSKGAAIVTTRNVRKTFRPILRHFV